MYKAIDIAIYIINYVNRKNESISNLKLQKILYYIQAAFLCDRDPEKGCFSDPILCWRHGPVIRNVYDIFNKYGAGNIHTQDTVTRIISENGRLKIAKIPFDPQIIKPDDKSLIERVVDALMPYDAWYLVDRTHEEAPWDDLKHYNEEITSESIYRYFSDAENYRRIYGKFN